MKITIKDRVEYVLRRVAGNKPLDWNWLTSLVNETFGEKYSVSQVKRAADNKAMVKQNGQFKMKGRAVE